MIDDRPSGRESLLAAALPVILLLPFIGKPFHMDDPLFVWLARHLQEEPVRFYDFLVHWHESPQPMYEVTMNPPGAGYLLAGAGALFGWSEVALHSVFLLAAATSGFAIYHLARECCDRPLLAVGLSVACPVFMISSSNVMSDTLMLALYTGAIALWVRGVRTNRNAELIGAVVLVTLGLFTKYMTVTLIPLLVVYTLSVERKVSAKHLAFLIPVAALVAYHFLTQHLFGQSMILGASSFATGHVVEGGGNGAFDRGLIALAFAGGCFAPVFIAVSICGERRDHILLAATVIAAIALLAVVGHIGFRLIRPPEGVRWSLLIQAGVWIAGGVVMIGLASRDLWKRKDPAALLLFLWIVGIVVFTAGVNWTINGRTLLPAAPAVGILIARQFGTRMHGARMYALVGIALTLALVLTWADFALARAQKEAAVILAEDIPEDERPLYRFQGHWGFQYYLQEYGFQPFDREEALRPGMRIIVPENSPSLVELPPEMLSESAFVQRDAAGVAATMHRNDNAGFYSHYWGPLPFYFGDASPERYRVYEIGLPADEPGL